MFWLETVKASFQLKEKSRNILCFSGLFNVVKCSRKTNTIAPKGNVRKVFLFFPPRKLMYIFHMCICSKIKLCMWKSLTTSVWEIERLDSQGFIQLISLETLFCARKTLYSESAWDTKVSRRQSLLRGSYPPLREGAQLGL